MISQVVLDLLRIQNKETGKVSVQGGPGLKATQCYPTRPYMMLQTKQDTMHSLILHSCTLSRFAKAIAHWWSRNHRALRSEGLHSTKA